MFIINFCLNMFRASLCQSSENKGSVTAFGVLFCFCWMWLVAVVRALRCRMRALLARQRLTTATNNIQQNQNNTPNAVTEPLFSEDWHNDARNMLRQKLIINI